MTIPPGLIVAKPKRPPCVLVCGKCVKTGAHGRAVWKALKAGLTERATTSGTRPGKLVATKCLGVCPKRAVALATGATLARGEVLVVKHAADAPAVLDLL